MTKSEDRASGVVASAITRIRDRIVAGEWAPGQRLVEPELMTVLGISRAALREALHRLASEGLVDLARYRGASVRRLDRADVAEIFEVRACLEGLAASHAARRVGAISTLQMQLGQLVDALDAADRGPEVARAYTAANAAFHAFVLEHAEAPTLDRLVPPLQMPLYRMVLARLLEPEARAASQAGHRVIAAALAAGDAASAETAMRTHVLLSKAAVLALPSFFE